MLTLRSRSEKTAFWASLAAIFFFLVTPVLWMILTSFKSLSEVLRPLPTILPEHFTMANYQRVLFETDVMRYVGNGLYVAVANGVLTTTLAALSAYGFAKFKFRGRRQLMLFLVAGQMFPYGVLLISLYPILQTLGLFDTREGLVLSNLVFALPASIYILFSYVVNIPDDLLDAARMDGASNTRMLFELVLPLMLPGMITVFLYSFMWSWNDLLYSLTLITSDAKRTVGPGLLLTFLGEMEQDWGAAMAGSVVVSLPVVLVFMAVQRFFIQGLTAGAVK